MKIKTLFLALAASLMLFAACQKEDSNGTIASNTFEYDGSAYEAQSRATIYKFLEQDDPGLIEFEMANDFINLSILGYLHNAHTCTYDLAENYTDISVEYRLEVACDKQLRMAYMNGPNGIYGEINGEDSFSSPFSSGTAKITVTDTHLNIIIDGVLTNGKTLKFNIDTDILIIE